MLRGRRLVVLGFRGDAELPQLLVHVAHERDDAAADHAEVVVVQLLALRRLCAEQGAVCVDQVRPALVHRAVDEEILLLRADGRIDRGDVIVAEQAQHALCLRVERRHRAKKRRLFVQRFSSVGAERGGDVQNAVLDEGIGGRIPRGVAARLECRADAAGGKGGGVGFASCQLLAGEFDDRLAVRGRRKEAVMLFGGDPGHRLEPVREMRRALFDRPVLHGVRYDCGDLEIEMRALADRPAQGAVGLLGQALAHDGVGKNHAAVNVRKSVHCTKAPLCASSAAYIYIIIGFSPGFNPKLCVIFTVSKAPDSAFLVCSVKRFFRRFS